MLPRLSLSAALLAALLTSSVLAQPIVSAVAPMPNTPAAPRPTSVFATFTQPLNGSAASGLKVFSGQRGGLRTGHSGSTTVTGSTVSFVPSYAFMPGETVSATLTAAAQNQSGQALVGPRAWQFTAAVGGSGLGYFGAAPTASVGGPPANLAVGDVDSDGDVDLLTLNLLNNSLSVRFNDGFGLFSGTQSVIVGNQPSNLALGDIDGDGDLDAVVSSRDNNNAVTVLANDGSGNFTIRGLVSVGNRFSANSSVSGLHDAVLADIDQDGDLDLVASLRGSLYSMPCLSTRFNNGTGTFGGGRDLIVSIPASDGPAGIVMGDLDGDGDLDVTMSTGYYGPIATFFNNSAGVFAPPVVRQVGLGCQRASLGDIDGDGDLDLVSASYSSAAALNNVNVCLNDGTGAFSSSRDIPMPLSPTEATLGDVDHDGDLDLVASCLNALSVRLNDGQGTFGNGRDVLLTNSSFQGHVTLSDLDGDADLDVMMPHTYSSNSTPMTSTVGVFLNQPNVVSAAQVTHPSAEPFTIVPNPSSNGTVQLLGLAAGQKVEVLDATGRLVGNHVQPQHDILQMALLPGLYMVRSGGQAQRLMVQ